MIPDLMTRRSGAMSRRRRRAGLSVVALATALTGCHTYLPPQDQVPVTGREIAVELNDRGRLLVVPQLGESVLRVHGTLVASTDSTVTMSVSRTVQLQGSSALWTGESVTIPVTGVRGFRLREFSQKRSVAMAVGVAGALAVVAPRLKIVGGGNGRPDEVLCTSSCNTTR
ncbi:MAG: hypothetical protein RL644_1720 [Actinomycetota bacterium]|jgi:hypothetical protein